MLKYHKEIGFLPAHIIETKNLINKLNKYRLSFSNHALQELSEEIEAIEIGQFLKNITLNFEDVFEMAIDNGIIEKLGFRVKFNEKDIAFIISRNKCIITLWTNNKDDKHYALDKNRYALPLTSV